MLRAGGDSLTSPLVCMANEKRLSFSFQVVKDGITNSLVLSANGDLAGNNQVGNVQEVGTSWEAINIADLGAPELIAVRNIHASATIDVAVANDDSGIFTTLTGGGGPKSMAYLPAKTGATYYAKASAAAQLQVVAVEA